MKVNERFIKISRLKADSIPISEDLEMDADVEIHISGQVVKIEDLTNNDGSVDRFFTIKGLLAEKE